MAIHESNAAERLEVCKLLNTYFDAVSFKRLLTSIDKKLSDFTNTESAQNTLPNQILDVVEKSNEQGWYTKLVVAAAAERLNIEPLQTLAQRLTAPPPAPGGADPEVECYKAYVMRGGKLFLGRSRLRTELQALRGTNSLRVLAISGEPKTGKTYTSDFLRYIHSCCPSVSPKLMHLDVDGDAESPTQLIIYIGEFFGVTLTSDKSEQGPRWVKFRVIPKIAEAVKANDKISEWWLLLDGFRSEKYPAELETFLEEFQKILENDLPQARLLLINYRNVDTAYVPVDQASGISCKDILRFYKHANQAEGGLHSRKDLKDEVRKVILEARAATADPKLSDQYSGILSRKITIAARRLFPHWMQA